MDVGMEVEDQKMLFQLAQDYKPGSTEWVEVTHINSPDSFYVRPMKYNPILFRLEKTIPFKKPDRYYMHQCVVFRSRCLYTPAQYIRGQVVHVNNTQAEDIYCDILAVDYGYIRRSVPSRRIWKCRDSVLDYPPFAIQCKLATFSRTDDKIWPQESIETLIDYLGGEGPKMTVIGKTNTKLIVELTDICPDDIASSSSMPGFSTSDPTAYILYREPPPPPKIRKYPRG